jgi:hypothetical protein
VLGRGVWTSGDARPTRVVLDTQPHLIISPGRTVTVGPSHTAAWPVQQPRDRWRLSAQARTRLASAL